MVRKISTYLPVFFLCLLISASTYAQIKVVILGSSTAAGAGASTLSNSWAGKFTTYVQSLNPSASVINLAQGGLKTNQVMPTGTGVGEDTTRNITKALTFRPNLIIVSLPTNDAGANFPISSTMANFRKIKQTGNAGGATVWITTSQGRDFGNTYLQNLLIETRDSVLAQFSSNALDFFTTVANADATIAAPYAFGDGIHLNDAGHAILYNRVKTKFDQSAGALPVYFTSFKASFNSLGAKLEWNVASNNDVLKYDLEKSVDGISFSKFGDVNPTANNVYSFVDVAPSNRNNFYRIKAITSSGIKYSEVLSISLQNNKPGLTIAPNPITTGILNLQFNQRSMGESLLTINNMVGQEIYRKAFFHPAGVESLNLQLPMNLAKGIYYLKLTSNSEQYNHTIAVQ